MGGGGWARRGEEARLPRYVSQAAIFDSELQISETSLDFESRARLKRIPCLPEGLDKVRSSQIYLV